jgi:hypothetical protein
MTPKLLGYRNSRDPSPPSKDARINIGDVGFIRRGKFHFLFSAGSQLGNREPGKDVPIKFEQLDVGTPDVGLSRRDPCLRTSTVRELGVDLSASASANLYAVYHRLSFDILKYFPSRPLELGAGFSFELTEDRGAALVTKYPTHRMDTMVEDAFEEYTKRHYKSWVEFARIKRYAKDVKPILVCGFDVTRDFAMVAYSHEGTSLETNVTFDVSPLASASASVWGNWHKRCPAHTQRGPQGYTPLSPKRTKELLSLEPTRVEDFPIEFNQCVFIRYFTVRWRMSLFPQVIKASAGPHDLGSGENTDDAFPELTMQSDAEHIAGGDDDLEGQWALDADGNGSEQGVVVHNMPSVRFLYCPFICALIFTFALRMRNMTAGMSSQTTSSR